jgi:hypothetical protein
VINDNKCKLTNSKNIPVIWKATAEVAVDDGSVIILNFNLDAFMVESLRKAADQRQAIKITFEYEREG